jgi:RND family efflux transporter MFP subunit
MPMKTKPSLPLAWGLLAAAALFGCGKPVLSHKQELATVTVNHPLQKPVADYVDLTGTVNPSKSVDLVARVPGYLKKVGFQDGTYVEAGTLLFVIEPEPYVQQLRLAEATLTRAKSEYERQVGLSKDNATSTANVEKWLSEKDQAVAQVELARINLGYTEVRAPFSGRLGRHLVDPDNLVGAGANTKLATIEQIIPIYVYFNLNERDTLHIRDLMVEHGIQPGSGVGKVPILVGLQSEQGYPHTGTLDFVDSGVSTSSGTIQIRASLTNENKTLFPGLFARVRIPLGDPQPMLIVPATAFGNDQEGDYVLVAETNDVVARRAVVKGPLTSDGCAVRSGLTPTDRVIVDGLMRAKPGTKVNPVTRAPSILLNNPSDAAGGHAAYRINSGFAVPCRPGAPTGRVFQLAARTPPMAQLTG